MGIPLFDSLPCPSCFDLGSQKSSSLFPSSLLPSLLDVYEFRSAIYGLHPHPLQLWRRFYASPDQSWQRPPTPPAIQCQRVGHQPMDARIWTHLRPCVPNGFGGLSRWRPGKYLVHNRFLPTNKITVFEVSVKSETPSSTANTGYAQLLATTQSLQQQVLMINQQLAGQ